MKYHTSCVYCLEYYNDGEKMASGSSDKSVIIWDSQKMKEIKKINFSHSVRNLKYQPNSKNLAVGLHNAGIQILNEEHQKIFDLDHNLPWL